MLNRIYWKTVDTPIEVFLPPVKIIPSIFDFKDLVQKGIHPVLLEHLMASLFPTARRTRWSDACKNWIHHLCRKWFEFVNNSKITNIMHWCHTSRVRAHLCNMLYTINILPIRIITVVGYQNWIPLSLLSSTSNHKAMAHTLHQRLIYFWHGVM